MRKIKRSLRGALRTVMAAVTMAVLALTLIPSAAFAAVPAGFTAVPGTGTVKLSELKDAESVELYKVASVYVNASGELHYEWDVATPPTGVTLGTSTDALTQAQANAIATQVAGATKVGTVSVSGGTATVAGLDAGLYYVKVIGSASSSTRVFQNIVVPVNPQDSNGDGAYTAADDYTATGVVYSVKSQDTSLAKTVKDGNATGSTYGETINTLSTGDTASFKLDVAVPFYNTDALSKTGANAVTFSVVDTLVTTYVKNPTNVVVSASGVTLSAGTDYIVTPAEGTLTVTFTPAGLAKLNSSEPSANAKAVTITYDATVVANAGTTGLVDINNAVLTFSKSSADPATTGTTSDKTQAQFYSLTIKKYGSDDANKLLSGAVFQLNGQNLPAPVVSVEGTDVIYTFPVALGSGDAFTLSETKAPTGYLKVADQTVTAQSANVVLSLTDQKDDASILPSTGGAGTIGLTVAGVAIMAGAAALVIRSRKQND